MFDGCRGDLTVRISHTGTLKVIERYFRVAGVARRTESRNANTGQRRRRDLVRYTAVSAAEWKDVTDSNQPKTQDCTRSGEAKQETVNLCPSGSRVVLRLVVCLVRDKDVLRPAQQVFLFEMPKWGC